MNGRDKTLVGLSLREWEKKIHWRNLTVNGMQKYLVAEELVKSTEVFWFHFILKWEK